MIFEQVAVMEILSVALTDWKLVEHLDIVQVAVTVVLMVAVSV